MINKHVLLSILLTSLLPHALTGQDAGQPPPEEAASAQAIELKDPVAVVNGRSISSEELKQAIEAQLARSGSSIDDIPPAQLAVGYQKVLDDLIIDILLEEKAKEVEVEEADVEENFARLASQFESVEQMEAALKESGESVEDVKESIRGNLRKRGWIVSRIEGNPEVTEAEVKEFYEGNPDSFQQPELVKASHILLMTPEDLTEEEVAEKKRALEAVKKKIEEGADFAEMAKEYSEDPGSKETGGDLDFFTKDRMVPEFAEAAFGTKVGEMSDIVKTQFGYHLIKVTDRKEARTVPLEEVRERVETFIRERKQQEALDQLLTALRQQSEVKVNLDLPSVDAPGE